MCSGVRTRRDLIGSSTVDYIDRLLTSTPERHSLSALQHTQAVESDILTFAFFSLVCVDVANHKVVTFHIMLDAFRFIEVRFL